MMLKMANPARLDALRVKAAFSPLLKTLLLSFAWRPTVVFVFFGT